MTISLHLIREKIETYWRIKIMGTQVDSLPSATKSVAKNNYVVYDPPLARFLFGDVRLSWLWLILRLYVGYEWINAGLEKIQNPAWFGAKAGTGMAGFVNGALQKTTGANPAVQSWYATFLKDIVLPNSAVWSYLITFGELLVGIGLILGIFTGIAAFFGSFMNVNYLLAGAVSTNPILFVIATWLVLAWKTAGWVGIDHWLLPALGTPWRAGSLFRSSEKMEKQEQAQ
jgi:thiosulfate dehydrogenase [quinone] large subunit